jgi:hypothetical protein
VKAVDKEIVGPGQETKILPGSPPAGSSGLAPAARLGDPGAKEKKVQKMSPLPGRPQSNAEISSLNGGGNIGRSSVRPSPNGTPPP